MKLYRTFLKVIFFLSLILSEAEEKSLLQVLRVRLYFAFYCSVSSPQTLFVVDFSTNNYKRSSSITRFIALRTYIILAKFGVQL